MKIINEVKINKKIIAWYSIFLIIVNLFLSFLPSFFLSEVLKFNTYSIGIFSFLLSGLFAPFFEETLLRGIFQNFLREKIKVKTKTNYIIVALIFSIFHLRLYFFPYFISSLFLSSAYDRSKRKLIVPILIHCTYNIFVMLLEILV